MTRGTVRRIARARQVRGRRAAALRAALPFFSRGNAKTCPMYPVDAMVALMSSVQADELDERCSAPSTHARGRRRGGTGAGAGSGGCARSAVGAEACAAAHAASRHSTAALALQYHLAKFKPAVPWEPEAASRLLAATVAAVRAARCSSPNASHKSSACAARAAPQLSDGRPALAQGVRILSRPLRPGDHPLRALRTGAARPTLPGREWAAVSCYADPVMARVFAAGVMDIAAWQWSPVPADFARIVLESDALHLIRRVLELGAAHAGRCVAACHVARRCCAASPCTAWGRIHSMPCSAL